MSMGANRTVPDDYVKPIYGRKIAMLGRDGKPAAWFTPKPPVTLTDKLAEAAYARLAKPALS